MYKPTEEELLELGFDNLGEEWSGIMRKDEKISVSYNKVFNYLNFNTLSNVEKPEIESIEDIKTLIRLFKLK